VVEPGFLNVIAERVGGRVAPRVLVIEPLNVNLIG